MEQLADLIGRDNMGNAIVIIILVAMVFTCIFFCEMYLRIRQRR